MIEQFSLEAVAGAAQIGRLLMPTDVVDETARLVGRFGVRSLTFCEVPDVRQGFADVLQASHWPNGIDEWFAEYTARGYFRTDPVLRQVKCATQPFLWSDLHVDRDRAPDGAALMRRRRDYGFNDAFVVPVHTPTGRPAFVSMGGFELELPPDARLAIHLLALTAFERIRELRRAPIARPVLTPREREVLTWVANGKTAWEIGMILTIAKRTVDEHVQTATRKLNACTRAHAVAIAIKDGHIRI